MGCRAEAMVARAAARRYDPDMAATFGFRDVDPAEKAGLVRGVFDSVASRYDLMNDLMSAGVHRLWKDATAARLNPQPGETIIDCAGGTGDMARRFAKLARGAQERRGGPDAKVFVLDYNAEMIAAGRAKGAPPEIAWGVGDAQALPLPDACADAYVISFGIRNVTDIQAALVEARRVLKPGGRFLCLEFSKPATEALQKAYDAYSFKVIPAIGELVAKDRASYQYLVESIRRFPDQKTFLGMIQKAGFGRAGYTNFTGGVAALHHGWAI
jgi:demethylmenaquinone methyltransferase/2-methoxy-6-polyprenyl-1,4-benzoquinol methylase